MKTISIQADTWEKLAESIEPGTPVLTLNLLRFRDEAEYPAGSDHAPCSGRTAYYERYANVTVPAAVSRGARVVLSGSAIGNPVCPPDEHWDDILMLEYPDVSDLTNLPAAPGYQDCAIHRTAALVDWRLLVIVRNELTT